MKVKKKLSKKMSSKASEKLAHQGPKLGERVSALELKVTGEPLDLQHPGGLAVLYFYPKDDTPGCTLEGQQFNDRLASFAKFGAKIFGISRDSIGSHEKFCRKMGFRFELISDEDERACKAFDVIRQKNMYGKMVRGIERSTFVIDQAGILLAEWRKVKAEGHAQEVLDFIANLKPN